MISLKSDEISVFWPNDRLTLTFYELSQIAYQSEQLLKFFDSMISLESGKITAHD